MINAIYYQYYSWYHNIIKSDTAELNAIVLISGNFAFLIIALFDLLATSFFDYKIQIWIILSIIGAALIYFLLYYYKSGKTKNIIIQKPLVFNNKAISIVFAILFIFISWGGLLTMIFILQ
jgi:hypothetical protein